jgi:hypothetical protein
VRIAFAEKQLYQFRAEGFLLAQHAEFTAESKVDALNFLLNFVHFYCFSLMQTTN